MVHEITGEQFSIAAGEYRATVTELGAGLRELTLGGEPLVLSYGADEPAPAAFGQLLIPWPNRIDGGRYTFDGLACQLDLSEPELGNAIHGLVRWANWTVLEQGPDRLSMEYKLLGSPGYPFRLNLTVTYVLDARQGLDVEVTAVNAGSRPAPYAHGMHPYLTVGEPIDACTVRVPGSEFLPVDDRMIPAGPPRSVEGTPYDLRGGQHLGERTIDVAYTGLERDAAGRAWVHLTGATRATSFWLDAAQLWLEIYTADQVPVDQRRRGLGVEPMTCPPNAFVGGADLVHLEPGAQYAGAWGITGTTGDA
ncbi:aldose 1-epimerase family protein [Streptomyces sp. NPDC048441]|uniref:aldose 1-epimerase family protein n=1 Tax=Streptomyces sp. NPDC048441 TaxID=3365552 RepID=UPI0037131F5B